MTGLDIGAAMIKAVALEQRPDGVVLRQAALASTPPGVATEGVLTDGIAVAKALKSLWVDYELSDSRVATAVSGERTVCQWEECDAERADREDYIRSRIAGALSYSVDAASSGAQEVEGGVVWVAAPVESVDWIRETVRLSAKTPAIVQIQSCALANAYAFNYEPEGDDTVLLVHVGARRASLVLMRGEIPVYGRDVVINVDWPKTAQSAPDRVLNALDLHWDQIQLRSEGGLSLVLVSGGPAASPDLRTAISRRTGASAEPLNAFRRISHTPGAGPGRVAAEHGASLTIAVGLALQGFEDQ